MEISAQKDERCDLALSTRSAARYLKWMRKRFARTRGEKSWLIAAGAYNAGFTRVMDRLKAFKAGSYWDSVFPRETEIYVPRWIALHIIDMNRLSYGFDLPTITPLEFESIERVKIAENLPLMALAALTDSPLSLIREMNGAVRRKTGVFRARSGGRALTHTIHVPKGWAKRVRSALVSWSYVKEK
jgi:membrane-bound lytic murein transglycosylase D